MNIIKCNFDQILSDFNLSNYAEISKKFIKSEEQIQSLVTYIDYLSNEINFLTVNNKRLEKSISKEKDYIIAQEKLRTGISKEELEKQRLEKIIEEKF